MNFQNITMFYHLHTVYVTISVTFCHIACSLLMFKKISDQSPLDICIIHANNKTKTERGRASFARIMPGGRLAGGP